MSEISADKQTHPQWPAGVAPDGIDAGCESLPASSPEEDGADEETGASPGTAQACSDLGLNSLAANLDRFGIKPPGQS